MQAAAEQPDPVVAIDDVRFAFGRRNVFEGVTLRIPRGKVTAVMGPSGCGKSTLLNFIGGRLRPDSGSVVVDGIEVPRLGKRALFELRKRIGMLFQGSALLTDFTAFENVAFPVREHTELPESLVRSLVLLKLQLVGLRGARDLYPAQMSGGMVRRVALARAMALDPMMVMYDEPFTGLDPISMGVIVKLIRDINDALSMTSIIVTHDVREGCSIADYVYVLGHGRVLASGTPQELERSESEEVRQFIGGLPDGPVPFHYPASGYVEDLLAGDGR